MRRSCLLLAFVLSSASLFSQEVINNKLELNGDFQFGPTVSCGDWVKDWGHRLWFSHLDDNTDPVFMARYNTELDASELRVSIGDCIDGRDKFSVGYTDLLGFVFTPMFVVQADGKVGIKTNDPQNELDVNGAIKGKSLLITDGNVGIGIDNPKNKLDVNGTIKAKEIKVELDPEWPDFVFKKGYKLPTLEEVKKHIEEKGTLPGVPNESDVKANGVNLGEVNALLLQKIEELTLYVIKQQEEINKLKIQINHE